MESVLFGDFLDEPLTNKYVTLGIEEMIEMAPLPRPGYDYIRSVLNAEYELYVQFFISKDFAAACLRENRDKIETALMWLLKDRVCKLNRSSTNDICVVLPVDLVRSEITTVYLNEIAYIYKIEMGRFLPVYTYQNIEGIRLQSPRYQFPDNMTGRLLNPGLLIERETDGMELLNAQNS